MTKLPVFSLPQKLTLKPNFLLPFVYRLPFRLFQTILIKEIVILMTGTILKYTEIKIHFARLNC